MRRVSLFILFCLLPFLTGCFSEQSFPMVPAHLAHMPVGQPPPARTWVQQMHVLAQDKLPWDKRDGITTDQLATDGKTLDVWKRFSLKPGDLDSILGNLQGIEESAQVSSPPPDIVQGHVRRAPWTGFKEVEVPVGNGVFLYGRLGEPLHSGEIAGSYIILTHGLFGSLDGYDIQNHAQALRLAGHHILALEMRGHGETNCRHPEYAITFGVFETGDLMTAANWLKSAQGAQRVGLVCFSLTGYEALLTAWWDGHHAVNELDGLPMFSVMPVHKELPAFDAGMFIVSAPVGVMNVADGFNQQHDLWTGPVKASFERRVSERLLAEHDIAGFSMWDLSTAEVKRSGLLAGYPTFDAGKADFIKFIDLGADNWHVGASRMNNVRIPVLILSAANDPLASGQNVAELFSRQNNPNIGVVLLKDGGHMGFSALSADYYYSLMLNFFDPATAPRAY